jgi:CubicO group peptidase (beta-lactamase class C family)
MARLNEGVRNTPTTVFRTASLSKQFTALAVALLAQQGKLSLDDDVRKYVPELPDYGSVITLRHLLYHTSGLREWVDLLYLQGRREDERITVGKVLDLAFHQKALNFPPGEAFLYCNTGYVLLGKVVERVSGQSLRTYTDAHVFQPLGMRQTHFRDDYQERLDQNAALGYDLMTTGRFQESMPRSEVVGSTGLVSSVEDLARWDQNFYDGRVGGKAVLGELLTSGRLKDGVEVHYGMGLGLDKYRGLRVVEHSGVEPGCRAEYLRFPDQRFSVILLCNVSTMEPTTLARQIADLYLTRDFDVDSRPAGGERDFVRLSRQELKDRTGTYRNPRSGYVLRLVLREGRLVLDLGRGIDLRALASDRFRLVGVPTEIRFLPVRRGETPRLRYEIRGDPPVDYEEVRLPRGFPSRDLLESSAGTYFSAELSTTYKLILHGDQLIAVNRHQDPMPLTPAFDDGFTFAVPSYTTVSLQLKRDPMNRVVGFTLTGPRSYKIDFVKIAGGI